MPTLLLLFMMALFPQAQEPPTAVMIPATQTTDPPQAPRNDPEGVWETGSGTKFQLKLITPSDLSVRLVEGSNPVYVKYEVNLKNTGEVNSYEGTGYFIAKVQDKECRFDTNWKIIVVQPETIVGYLTGIVPEPGTCDIKERREDFAQIKKVQ